MRVVTSNVLETDRSVALLSFKAVPAPQPQLKNKLLKGIKSMYFSVVWAFIITTKKLKFIHLEVGSIMLKVTSKDDVVAGGGATLASNFV